MTERLRLDADSGLEVVRLGAGRPRVAVLGGVHGDELEGIVAAGQLIHVLRETPLRGRVDVVAVANPPAYAARSRTTPEDGRNLAREFPGDAHAGPTRRLAHLLTTEVIAGADLLVDLHSAGAHYAMPVFAGYCAAGPTGPASRAAAEAFAAPVVWRHPEIGPGRSLSAAAALGVPSIYVEGSGGGGLRGADLDVYIDGVLRTLAWLDVVDGRGPVGAEPVRLDGGSGDVDASVACTVDGLCVTRAEVGTGVAAGGVVAQIVAPDGAVLETITAPRDSWLMMLRRTAEVRAGDGIAMFGPPPTTERR